MTPREIKDAISALMKETGIDSGNLSIGIEVRKHCESCLRATYWPDGVGSVNGRKSVYLEADDWAELLSELRSKVLETLDETRAMRARLMAMALIDLADGGNTDVTDRDLRLKGFSQAEIDDLGAGACEEALRLGRGPFCIVSTQQANAA